MYAMHAIVDNAHTVHWCAHVCMRAPYTCAQCMHLSTRVHGAQVYTCARLCTIVGMCAAVTGGYRCMQSLPAGAGHLLL